MLSNALIPINFKKWIEDNRHLLKPPVGNLQIWENREFMVTVVGGPNSRSDYHINEGEEFFYQLEGDMTLRVLDPLDHPKEFLNSPQGIQSSWRNPKNITLRAGEIFLLPPRVPHSPQRPEGTLGLVIERKRQPTEEDGFVWFCEKCGELLHFEFLHVTDIVQQLKSLFQRFYSNTNCNICKKCGTHARKN